jgi:hypothetical protein
MAVLPTTEVFGLPPDEAIQWFRSKGYAIGFDHRDVWAEEHAMAFTVAKAMQLDVLADIRQEVDAALANGTNFNDFKKALRPKLQAHGWWGEKDMVDPKTGETKTVQLGSARRLKTIYDTNLRTAHAAGKWQRIEARASSRPYLRYFTKKGGKRRAEHQKLNDLVRPVTDPIWRQIYPPNGFGCGCGVQQLNERDVKRLGLVVSDPLELEYRTIVNERTGEIRRSPVGVDPGWDFNVGMVRRPGNPLEKYPVLQPVRSFKDYGRPGANQLRDLPKQPPSQFRRGDDALSVFRRVFGTSDSAPEALIKDPQQYQVGFSEGQLLAHVGKKADQRQRWFAHAKVTVEDPYEIWMVPHRRKDGSVVMRRRYIGVFDPATPSPKAKTVLVVVEENGAITSIPYSGIDRQRQGYLLYAKDEK